MESEKDRDAARADIARKVAAAQARPNRQARAESLPAPPVPAPASTPVPDKERPTIVRLAEQHPFALLAGGIAIGVIAANTIPASLLRRWGKNAWGMAALATELGLSLGTRAADNVAEVSRTATHTGRKQVDEWATAIIDGSEDARHRAGEMVENATDAALSTGETVYRQLLDWGRHLRK